MMGKMLFTGTQVMHVDRAFAAIVGMAYPLFSIWCLAKSSSRRASVQQTSAGVIGFGRAFRIWWLVTIALCALGFSSDLFLGKVRPDETTQFWLTFGGFVLLSAFGTWMFLRYRVEYNEESIVIHSPLGTRRRIDWTEVVSVRQVKGTGLVIAIQGQKREVIPSLVTGASDFVETARLRKRC